VKNSLKLLNKEKDKLVLKTKGMTFSEIQERISKNEGGNLDHLKAL